MAMQRGFQTGIESKERSETKQGGSGADFKSKQRQNPGGDFPSALGGEENWTVGRLSSQNSFVQISEPQSPHFERISGDSRPKRRRRRRWRSMNAFFIAGGDLGASCVAPVSFNALISASSEFHLDAKLLNALVRRDWNRILYCDAQSISLIRLFWGCLGSWRRLSSL